VGLYSCLYAKPALRDLVSQVVHAKRRYIIPTDTTAVARFGTHIFNARRMWPYQYHQLFAQNTT